MNVFVPFCSFIRFFKRVKGLSLYLCGQGCLRLGILTYQCFVYVSKITMCIYIDSWKHLGEVIKAYTLILTFNGKSCLHYIFLKFIVTFIDPEC